MLLSLSLGYRWATAGALAVLLAAVLLYTSFLFPFLAGAALSFVLSRYRPRLPMILALPVLGAGLYLLGFLLPLGTYTWVSQAPPGLKDYAATLLHSAGSVLVIVAVLCSAGLYRRLDRRIWWALGRVSFPLFLVHPLVVCSVSSAVYLDLSAQGTGPAALLAAMFAVSFGLSILLSVPLAWLDHRWCASCFRIRRRRPPRNRRLLKLRRRESPRRSAWTMWLIFGRRPWHAPWHRLWMLPQPVRGRRGQGNGN
jgi:peptidoglycan/LPS O-acetylase OafA/YrhL